MFESVKPSSNRKHLYNRSLNVHTVMNEALDGEHSLRSHRRAKTKSQCERGPVSAKVRHTVEDLSLIWLLLQSNKWVWPDQRLSSLFLQIKSQDCFTEI